MMSTAVIGARAAPAKAAPIPMTANTPAPEEASGATTCPKAAPAIAPMNSVGAKTPPEPPMPIVNDVKTARPTIRASRNATVYSPPIARSSSG